jgi:hypothetical protein
MNMGANNKPILSVLVAEDKKERFSQLAKDNNQSMGWLLNQAIDKMLAAGSIHIYRDSIEPNYSSSTSSSDIEKLVRSCVDESMTEHTSEFVTRDDVQAMINEAMQLLQAAGLDSSSEDGLEDEDEFTGWGVKEFSDENGLGIAAKDGAAAIREALVAAGLDSQVLYNSSSKKFFPIEAE